MTTYRFVAVATVVAFATLFSLVSERGAFTRSVAASTNGPPGLVVAGKEPGWFELRGTPMLVDDLPVKDWSEVNVILDGASYEAVPQPGYQLTPQTYGELPDLLDGGAFTITVRDTGLEGASVKHFMVRRWFPKKTLFSRASPSELQRFEVLDGLHLN